MAIMALIAACAMEPGEYFAINMKGRAGGRGGEGHRARVSGDAREQMADLAARVGEKTMFGRTGGAPTFAVGMAHMFSGVLGARRRSRSGITSRSCSRRCSS